MKPKRLSSSGIIFFIIILFILVMSSGGHIVVGDEETMFQVTQNIVEGNGIAINREEIIFPAQNPPFHPNSDEILITTSAVPGADDRHYSKYGIGQSILAIPFYIAGQFWENTLSTDSHAGIEGWTSRIWVSMVNPFILAITGWLLFRFAVELGFSAGTSRFVSVGAIFSTMMWPYAKTHYPQPAVALLVLLAVYSAYKWRVREKASWLWLLSTACGLAVMFRLSSVIIIPPLIVYLSLSKTREKRWHWFFPMILCLGVGFAITAGLNSLRFGSPFETGYHEVVFDNPPLYGLYGLLFSPGKGIFFYAPILVLSLVALITFFQDYPAEGYLILGLWVCYIAFYSPYKYWTGGFNWGPRFLIPIIPLAVLPLGMLLENKKIWGGKGAFILLFSLGIFIQLPSIIVDHSRSLYQTISSNNISEAYTQSIMDFQQSPIIRQWPTTLNLVDFYRKSDNWERAMMSIDLLRKSEIRAKNDQALLRSEFIRRNLIDLWWLTN